MSKFWNNFNKSRKSIGDQYSRSSSVLSFNHDGLEIARTRRTARWLPIWHIIFFIYLALLIRLVAMAEVGPAAYKHRMDVLENGSFVEKAAAWVMHMDPVSRSIAYNIRSGLRKLEGN